MSQSLDIFTNKSDKNVKTGISLLQYEEFYAIFISYKCMKYIHNK